MPEKERDQYSGYQRILRDKINTKDEKFHWVMLDRSMEVVLCLLASLRK